MTEREMEWLLWNHPTKFFDEPLKPQRQQHPFGIGRSDLIFEDRGGVWVIVEIKLGRLPRSAVVQVNEYQEAVQRMYPGKRLRLMLVANTVPEERAAVCARMGIECRAIPENQFREVAAEVDFVLASEKFPRSRPQLQSTKRRPRPVSAVKKRGACQSNKRDESRVPEMPFPVIPEAAWYGLSRLYREALAESTEASDNCHFAGFLVAAGVGLGRAVYLKRPKPLYPNLFVGFVERMEAGLVEEAINFVERLIDESAPQAGQIQSLDSREGMIQYFSEIQSKQSDRNVRAVLLLPWYLSFFVEGNYKGGRRMMQFLTEIYDCQRPFEIRTQHKRVIVDPPPCISLITSSDDDWAGRLKLRSAQRGIGDRIIFISGERKPLNPDTVQPAERLWEQLVARLQEIFQFWHTKGGTELCFTDGARQLWSTFHSSLQGQITDDPLLRLLTRRYSDSALKCGLIFAALDKSDFIAEQHLEAGIAFAEFLFQSLQYVMGRPLRSTIPDVGVKIDEMIIDYVKRQPGQRVMWKVLRNRMHRVCPDQKLFEERMHVLTSQDGALKVESLGRTRWILSNAACEATNIMK